MVMTAFDSLVGNEQIKLHLKRILQTQAIGSSLLFAGPDGVGKMLFAKALAAELLKAEKHPDLHIYSPEGKVGFHSIDSMRQLSEEVYLAPFSGQWKVFIIQEAERMQPYSANALLKTIEEPATDTLILLISSTPEALLPTIFSRCQTIYFQPISENEILKVIQEKHGLEGPQAKKTAIMAKGSIGNALSLLQEGGHELRDLIIQILAKGKMHSYQELNTAAAQIADKVNKMKEQVENSSREELPQVAKENLTAVQLQAFEKEIEGVAAMRMMSNAQALFEVILGWFRDLHLLNLNGDRRYLIHPDFEEELEQRLQRGGLLPLETFEKAIAQAALSLERSTSLNLCLETLFLQINLL
jgi:DNA polymerase III subunit delta'